MDRDETGLADGVLRPRQQMTGGFRGLASRASVRHQTGRPDPLELRARKTRRSEKILAAIHGVDSAPTPQAQAEIQKWLQDVYDARGGGPLVGLFSHCYLGGAYVDHALNFAGEILAHYTRADVVPAMYAAARPFAASDVYAYIEIYADGQVIPIREDGSAVL